MRYLQGMGLVTALALALAGCPSNNNANSNDNSAANANDNMAVAPLYPATWQRTSGTIFGGIDRELSYLVLNEDSTADVHYRNLANGFVTCASGLFDQSAAMLTVSIAEPWGEPVMMAYHLLDANTLELMGADGDEGLFSRAALPAEAQCLELTVLNTFTGLPRPHSATGLAYNGAFLFYTDGEGLAETVSLTGVAVSTRDLSFGVVHAYQDAGMWLVSTTSDTDHVQRRNGADTLVDQVDTAALGNAIRVQAVAYDAVGHVLWLHGLTTSYPYTYQFLRVDLEADPHVLLGAAGFDTEVLAMAFDGASLWLLLEWGEQIIQIDPATLSPLHSYAVPAGGSWYGMAWAEGALFLIGTNGEAGVLVQTQP